jgi:hemoglobin/transferrin/lactoferrin receptor protein
MHITLVALTLAAVVAAPAEEYEEQAPAPIVSAADLLESAAAQPPERTLPPIEVRPGDEGEPAGPFDRPSSYPSLSDQLFEGLNGLLRGDQSLFDIPQFGNIVDRPRLEEKQASDMIRALEGEVGILIQSTARGQASPFVRGLTGQQVLILIDGIRLNNSTFRAGPNQYFNLIDPGMVERVEVVRGPQSTLWGSDAVGGAINVVTRGPWPYGGNYRRDSFVEYFSTADSGSYSRLNFEGWVGGGGFFGGGSYLNVHDLDTAGPLGRQPFTNYDQYAGDLKLNYCLDGDQMLTLALQHFEQDNVPRSDRFEPFVSGPPANAARPTFFDPQQRDLAYVRWQGLAHGRWFDAFSVTASYGRQKEGSSELRSPTQLDIGEFDVNTFGFTLLLASDLCEWGRLTYGADYYYDDVDAFKNRFNPQNPNAPPSPRTPQFPDDSLYDRAGVFLHWDVDLTCRLRMAAGVRYENVNASGTPVVQDIAVPFERSYHDWIGSVGLVYEVAPCWRLVGSISEGFRAPNLDDLVADNPFVLQGGQDLPSLDVAAEHSVNYEIGVKFDGQRLRFQCVEFWTDLENNILRQAVDGAGNPVPNVLNGFGLPVPGSNNFVRDNFDSYINGTEIAGELLLEEGWSVYGNFWYTFGKDVERNEPLSRIPPAQGILGTRWRDECRRGYFDVYGWFVRRQERYAAQNNNDSRFPVGATPGYGLLNMRVGTTLGEYDQHRLSLSLENITDRAYRVLGSGVDGAGFNALFGYELVR